MTEDKLQSSALSLLLHLSPSLPLPFLPAGLVVEGDRVKIAQDE